MSEGVEFMALNLGAYLRQRQPIEMRDSYDGLNLALYSSEGGLDQDKLDGFLQANADRFQLIYALHCDADPELAVPEWSGTDVTDFYRAVKGRSMIGVAEGVALDDQLMRFIESYCRREHIALVLNSSKSAALQHGWSEIILGGWIASAKQHELQVFDGKKVVRVSRDERPAAVERYWAAIENLGVDPDEIAHDSADALKRLAVRSWVKFADKGGQVVDIDEARNARGGAREPGNGLDISARMGVERQRVTIPSMSRELLPAQAEGGTAVYGPYRPTQKLLRQCSVCIISGHCPSFEEGASCGFEIPVSITTKAELQQAQSAFLEMQAGRVIFERFAEDVVGQGLNPNLSQELERWFRMVESVQRSSQQTETLIVQHKAQAGVLSQLFGSHVGEANTALAGPIPTDALATVVFDAEVLEIRDGVPEKTP